MARYRRHCQYLRGCASSHSEPQHLQQLRFRQVGQILQQDSHNAAARLTLQWLQGLLWCVHAVSPGGRWRASGEAQESHLQRRALWEYCWVDSGKRSSPGNATEPTMKSCRHKCTQLFLWYFLPVFNYPFNVSFLFQDHWWAVLLMGIALIMLMAGFIKICSVHTPSSNPKLPPPKPLPGTLPHICFSVWNCEDCSAERVA